MRSISSARALRAIRPRRCLKCSIPNRTARFQDHYIDLPFDLSHVLFVTTANDASAIPGPLYDRMDVITLGSYTAEEKFHIASKYLVPKQLKKHGIKAAQLRFTPKALHAIIEDYTREAGVRTVERTIGTICRKSRAASSRRKISSLIP